MIKRCSPAKAPKIAVEFNNNNVDNSDYFTTSTFNNVVRSQIGNFFIMHENIHSYGFFFDEFHSFASELNRAADVIVLSETRFSASTCHDIQGYTGIHTYCADKRGGGVSVFFRNCYTSTHIAKFSVFHAYYEISVAKVSLSTNCSVIIIGGDRPPDKSKIPEFTITLNEIVSSTSQSDHVLIVGDLNIYLLGPIAIENDFINNCHSNSLIPLTNKHTRNANNNPSILDHIWTNQLYDTFNGIFLLDKTDHYPISTIAPINCPQKRIRVKFIDLSVQNLAKLKIQVEHYLNNHVQINQDVSANTRNFCNNLFVIYSQCCPIKEKEIYFTRLLKPWISDAIMVSLNRKHKLFRQYKNGIVTFGHYNFFKNNFTTTQRHARNNYFQSKFTECSNNSRDT